MDDELYHYGTPRHSGRYPWGSGENPYQRNQDFLGRVNDLRKKGMSEVDIAKAVGVKNTKQLRAKVTIAKSQNMSYNATEAYRLKEKGMSNVAIAKRMGTTESNVRKWLKPSYLERAKVLTATSDVLKNAVDEQKYIDIGRGVNNHLGISEEKMAASVEVLKQQGYKTYNVYVKQIATGKDTTIRVLASPDVTYSDVVKNRGNIGSIVDFSEDGGRTYFKPETPKSISADRVMVRYSEQGGKDKDGVIELRRGVPDLNLGQAKYAQVRIGVDGSHYLKGMAMYTDEKLPDGVDIIFNTNKHEGTPKLGPKDNSVLKPMGSDPSNPFGASLKKEEQLKLVQRHYTDKDGKQQLSALNIVNEEGSWGEWSKTISSQFLSKQSPSLAKRQLDLAYDIKKSEFDDIMSVTNPAVKKNLLKSFSDECDADAVHLSAAALPRQGWHAILPIPSLSDKEIYAPNYNDGEQVALVRFPHGGKFEIPTLTVNNKSKEAKSVMGQARDAVGINPKVAEILSGADFDGDTVLVIPTKESKIQTMNPLEQLKNFDPKEAYPHYEGMKRMTPKQKGREMGMVSNLITDMTIKGANEDELARAVKHSMVVIDAEKHYLNYKQSYEDQRIDELKRLYQSQPDEKYGGVSTLISRAKSPVYISKRKEITNPKIMTPDELEAYKAGKKIFRETGETKDIYRKDKDGNFIKVGTQTSRSQISKMEKADDAYELSSGTRMEAIYANYANQMKNLGDMARKAYRETPNQEWVPSAAKTYSNEVSSLKAKLQVALKNAPLERKAQGIANSIIEAKIQSNPELKDDKDKLKKIRWQALDEGRARTGAKKTLVSFTDKEWEAVQSGAISNNVLTKLLMNADSSQVRKLATPRTSSGLSPAKESMAKSLLAKGYTQAAVAEQLDCSVSLIRDLL